MSDSESSTGGESRKRGAESNLFAKSKRTARTPTKGELTPEGSKEQQEIKEMLAMVLQNINEMRKEQKTFITEINSLKEENNKLKARITKLEEKTERIESQNRRNNVIIKGLAVEQNVEEEVNRLLESKLNSEIKPESIKPIKNIRNTPIILLKFKNSEDKNHIMKNRSKLKGSEIYIENDMTKEERRIQFVIRKRAKEERRKGNKTNIGFKTLYINGTKWIWESEVDSLVQKTDPKNG